MSIKVSEPKANYQNNSDRPKNPDNGSYAAKVYALVLIGTVTSKFKDQDVTNEKIRMTWEYMCNGFAYYISKEYTLSLHEKATLRKDLQSLRGKKFTQEELDCFIIDSILGFDCLITIENQTAANGNDYPNLISMCPLPKGMPIHTAILPSFIFSWEGMDKFEQIGLLSDEDNRIPKFIKEKMLSTPEYKKWNVDPFEAPVQTKAVKAADFDCDDF